MQAALTLNNQDPELAPVTRGFRATHVGVLRLQSSTGWLSTPVMSLNTQGLTEPLPLIGFYAMCGEAIRPSLSSKPASLASS